MMTEELIHLKNEFKRIKNMGYVKSTRGGVTGIGKTFEDLLGKKEDTLETPDYHGIEIKTKRGYSKAYTTLFNATVKGKEEFEIKRIVKTYGYPDSMIKSSKVLNVSVQANCSTLIGNRYLFKLNVDYENERIYLSVSDKNMYFLEQSAYWDFKTLKEKLEKKFQYLALIKAWPKSVNGVDYYKYYDISFYELKSFDNFLKLIEDGAIRITFKVGIFRNGKRKGEIHDRGTGFEIQECDMQKLFNEICI